MTTDEFAKQADNFYAMCRDRITGVGALQYYDDRTKRQAFEDYPPERLFEMAREELYDLANYALMLSIRLHDMQERACHDRR